MKNILFLSLLFLSLSIYSLEAQSGGTAGAPTASDELTPGKERIFSAYVGNLLSLEDAPILDGESIAMPVKLYNALLNLLCWEEDYFHLFTAKAGSFIDEVITLVDGRPKHRYIVKRGQENVILGYLACGDRKVLDATAANAAKEHDSEAYQYFSHLGISGNILRLHLYYDFLSSNLIESLYGKFYDPKYKGEDADFGTHVWMITKPYTTNLKESNIPQNVFELDLCVSLNDKDAAEASEDYDNWNHYESGKVDPDHQYIDQKGENNP